MAPPRKRIPWRKAKQGAEAGLTFAEVAAHVGVDVKTMRSAIRRTYNLAAKEWLAERRTAGAGALKLAQYRFALKGNERLLIFLGRSRLGQEDRRTHEHHVTGEYKAMVQTYEAGPAVRLPNNHRDDPAAVAGKNGSKPTGETKP